MGPYIDPNTSQGSIIVNNPMDLLCTDFMKLVTSKEDKENTLLLTNSFSKSSVAVIMPNQLVKTLAKALVEK